MPSAPHRSAELGARFRIYYGDGSTYSGDPFAAPRANVQVIAQADTSPRGFHLMHGKTLSAYYLWRDGAWWVADDAGFWDYLLLTPGPKCVLFGRSLRDEQFFAIQRRAAEEGLGVAA